MIRSTLPLGVCLALMGMVASDSRAQDPDKASNSIPVAHTSGGTQAELPDWSGQWEIIGSTPNASGGFEQSLDEALGAVRQWGPPPYKPNIHAMVEQAEAFVEKGTKRHLRTGPPASPRRHAPSAIRSSCCFHR
jgi:hypothetical protein